MLDKVEYWLELCDDDLRAAKAMLESRNLLWAGFICHLIAEKALKAAMANITNEIPPRTHDLFRLAKNTGFYDDFSTEHLELLSKLTPLQIEARYPEYKDKIAAALTESYCENLLNDTEGFLCWIKTMLGK